MKDYTELREFADKSDDPTRRRITRFIELRNQLAELTGDDTVHEATPMLGLLYEGHPHKREIQLTARRLRALGRVTFSAIKP
jgi:hypothetical protein